MSIFEDVIDLRYQAHRHDDVETVTGPASIETIHEAVDVWEKSNDRTDGTLVIDHPTASEIDRGWVVRDPIAPVPLPREHREEFDPVEDVITIVEQLGEPVGLIVRSDAVRLDMEILDPTGVVAIDFDRGESSD